MRKLRIECCVCHKILAGKVPKNGDGTAIFPHKHKSAINANEWCEGEYMEGYYFGHPYANHKSRESFE